MTACPASGVRYAVVQPYTNTLPVHLWPLVYNSVHMSMNMDMSGGSTEYADHEVQVITNQMSGNGSGANDSSETATLLDQLEPVSNRGLDSDELAELVAMYRVHFLDTDGVVRNNQTEAGQVDSESAIGINLSEDEFPTQANANNATSAERRLIENQNDLVGNPRGANYSEPGALDFTRAQTTTGFYELIEGPDTSGPQGSAGAGGVTKERFIDFRTIFGSGPYVDRTDDVSVFAELQATNVVGEPTVESGYILYWNVEEMPEGRASFARP